MYLVKFHTMGISSKMGSGSSLLLILIEVIIVVAVVNVNWLVDLFSLLSGSVLLMIC